MHRQQNGRYPRRGDHWLAQAFGAIVVGDAGTRSLGCARFVEARSFLWLNCEWLFHINLQRIANALRFPAAALC